MKPFNRTTQCAFASFNAMYDESRRRSIFDVTAITMRKKPIYQHVHVGRPINETNTLAGFFRAVHVYLEVKAASTKSGRPRVLVEDIRSAQSFFELMPMKSNLEY